MGELTIVLLGALAVAGALLVGLGVYARARLPLAVGGAMLLGVASAWLLGLAGIAIGLVAFAVIMRIKRPNPSERD
jgi:hypothetical protein